MKLSDTVDPDRFRYDVAEELGLFPLLDSAPLKRLNEISFLGLATRVLDGGSDISRLEHSIGAARLAHRFARNVRLGKAETKLVVAAALLHDIGHMPFSHVSEPFFQSRIGRDHHSQTLEILRGELEVPTNGIPIFEALDACQIQVKDVLSVLRKRTSHPLSRLLRNSINIDTVAGITQSAAVLGTSSVEPDDVVRAMAKGKSGIRLASEHFEVLAAFWRLKDRIYNQFIYSLDNLAAETMWLRALELAGRESSSIRGWRMMTDIQLESELMRFADSMRILEAISSGDYYSLIWRARAVRNRRVSRELLKSIDYEATSRHLASALLLTPDSISMYPRVFRSFYISQQPNGLVDGKSRQDEDVSRVFRYRRHLEILCFVTRAHADRIVDADRLINRHLRFDTGREGQTSVFAFPGGPEL